MTSPNNYSNLASVAQLAAPGMDTSTPTLVVNSATFSGFPNPPFPGEIARGTASAEVVEVTAVSGTTLTVARAQGGTAASPHNPGDTFEHIVPAKHFQDAEAHEAASTDVHGIPSGASVVGTTGNQIIHDKLYEGGLRHTFSDTQPAGLSAAVEVDEDTNAARDALVVNNTAGDPDRYAVLLNQNGTPRFGVRNDGTVKVTPNGAATRVALEVDGATTTADLTATGNVTLSGTATITTGVVGSETISGDLALPLPASGADTSDRVHVAGNAGQNVFAGGNGTSTTSTVDSAGNIGGASLTVSGDVSARGGKIVTTNTNSGHDWGLTTQIQKADGTTNLVRALRQPLVWSVRDVARNIAVPASDTPLWAIFFTPRTACEAHMSLSLLMTNVQGASGNVYEPCKAQLGWQLQDSGGVTTYVTSDFLYTYDAGGSPTPWGKGGEEVVPVNEVINYQLTAGTQYKILFHGSSSTTLKPVLQGALGVLTEVTLLGAVTHS